MDSLESRKSADMLCNLQERIAQVPQGCHVCGRLRGPWVYHRHGVLLLRLV